MCQTIWLCLNYIVRCIKNLLNNKHGLIFFFLVIKFWKSIVAYSRLRITLENKILLNLWAFFFVHENTSDFLFVFSSGYN
jgi:hypothetical protein